jgi:predicted Zn-dependent peptidase
MNAFTGRDYTCLYARVLDTQTHKAIDVIADVIEHSLFCDFEKERQVILEEIASIEDVPEDFVHDLMAMKLWPGDPLGRPITGFCETVSSMRLDTIRAYHAEWYRPGNMVLAVSGHFDPERVIAQAEEAFGALPPGKTRSLGGSPTLGSGLENALRDIGQSHVGIAFPGPSVQDERRYVYEMLSSILGGGSTSRLFDRVREQEGLAYSVYSFRSSYIRSGLLGLYAAAVPENLPRILDTTFEELRFLREGAVGGGELELSKEQLKGGFLMALEDMFSRMSRMAKCIMYHGRYVPADEVIAGIDAVTPAEIHELANEILRPERCAAVVLGPSPAEEVIAL